LLPMPLLLALDLSSCYYDKNACFKIRYPPYLPFLSAEHQALGSLVSQVCIFLRKTLIKSNSFRPAHSPYEFLRFHLLSFVELHIMWPVFMSRASKWAVYIIV
jgi:hypothetical protein